MDISLKLFAVNLTLLLYAHSMTNAYNYLSPNNVKKLTAQLGVRIFGFTTMLSLIGIIVMI